MAPACTQEAIVSFLRERGGKVRNRDLVEHFKLVFPEEPERRTALRQMFKHYVDNVAFVKTEMEVKYVCLKKRFRGAEGEHRCVSAGSEHVTSPPGSGYGSDSQVRLPRAFNPESFPTEQTDQTPGEEMGNRESFKREKRESKRERLGPDAPVLRASAHLPVPGQTGPTRQVETGQVETGLRPGEAEAPPPEGLKEVEHTNVAFRSPTGVPFRQPESDEEEEEEEEDDDDDEGPGSPKDSRKHFLEVMLSSEPHLRRSMVIRDSVYLSSSRNDGDSASLVSSDPDDERASAALDPLEHEWMLCSSDGEWGSLYPLLATEPSLVLRKDFVSGFTCLHWAAKQGKPELMALLINFAKQHDVPISANVRSNAGYTPLHVAAMHNHMEVVKLLVGAYSADVEIRDYSGRKACQYLTDGVSVDIRDIIGAYERSDSEEAGRTDAGRWRFSKALQANLKPLRLLHPDDGDSVDGGVRPREKVLRRKSSLSRMKHKLRLRTSQIVHSTTFYETEEQEGTGSFKSRPKTHFFG